MVIDASDKFAKKAAAALTSNKLIAYDGRSVSEEIDHRVEFFPDDYNALIEKIIIQGMT